LGALARRFPQVAWLQIFHIPFPHVTEEQKARMRKRANIHAGIEMVFLGMVLPLGYLAVTVMFFNKTTTLGVILVLSGSVLLIALGVTAIVRSLRR
jgi:hypothetical protein